MWDKLERPWKDALEMAWEAYGKGTIPIGCVIVNEEGDVISRGRNRIFDKTSNNPLAGSNMAHAEMTAMLGLSERVHPNIRSYGLYTTMEPCPMCFGTMVMMNMRNLFYGARDTLAGAVNLNDKMEYIKSKSIKIHHYGGDIEVFQLILSTVFEYERQHPGLENILRVWRNVNEAAVEYAKLLYQSGYFKEATVHNEKIEQVYDQVLMGYYSYFSNDQIIEDRIFI